MTDENVTDELERKLALIAPKFFIDGSCIQVLLKPDEFYSNLKKMILEAKRNVFLTTLYIGKEEKELIEVLRSALTNNSMLQVSIVADALRSTRETPKESSASLLVTLKKEFPERVQIRLYHTPNLHGFKKRVVPPRMNEGWGLQHMKIYGADDAVMLSGANLSHDYFTNRQDRYHIIHDKEVTAFYHGVHQALCKLSFACNPNSGNSDMKNAIPYKLEWKNSAPSPLHKPRAFKREASSIFRFALQPGTLSTQKHADTVLYPLFQLTPILAGPSSESTEATAVCCIGEQMTKEKIPWTFTAGYFNVYQELRRHLLSAKGKGTVVVASQTANGFYKSPGPSGMIPGAYQYIAERFLSVAKKLHSPLDVEEYARDKYTYHAKGIWLNSLKTSHPFLTTIGSSNYTRRSLNLDLEATAVIVTRSAPLQLAFAAEIQNIRTFSCSMQQKTLAKVPLYVKTFTKLFQGKL
ncbi:CDP-diacylglycerol-glycerol-3-phosphate3-phosphatidyltransferase [Schizosaccharomyces japonicus yFS275]|uniref:CDP-diacylglycerol--glycerol-3-phosphate 3-phosphatidyltransferase n=1 Tax=Schizosaccharomyces japonicus (strain yFS275 / FY16936) TaxID=402676 RepID=B6JXM8_SCHJY|nr:CDP-diacylglycerol-glycerol-3-phosphate3-phosphatidyltransferase [Schizosaccharomyces japonicus yFS275]EEB05172.1 CDP-diacylglycerol-glycerol-3-phosphate3-phosphatidyltransferase [Schizosaccharomyces japonicus yFS275]